MISLIAVNVWLCRKRTSNGWMCFVGLSGYSCTEFKGQSYSECALPFGNCRDMQFQSNIPDAELCLGGCRCGENELLNDYKVCSNVKDCTCYDQYSKGIYNAGAKVKQLCTDWYVTFFFTSRFYFLLGLYFIDQTLNPYTLCLLTVYLIMLLLSLTSLRVISTNYKWLIILWLEP